MKSTCAEMTAQGYRRYRWCRQSKGQMWLPISGV